MALIHCPSCGEMISEQAASCPKCGAPINTCRFSDLENKVNTFLQLHSTELPSELMPSLRDKLLTLPPKTVDNISFMSFKDPAIALIISIFFGGLGIDRFFIGDVGLGIVKLITCGGCGIWTLIDWFLIMGETKKHNYSELVSLL